MKLTKEQYQDLYLIPNLPDGKSKEWTISTFQISANAARMFNARDVFRKDQYGIGSRAVIAGTYRMLSHRYEGTVMSTTPAEINDFIPFIEQAKGKIFIAGLGLGCVIKALLLNPEITEILVVEKSEDVISLVKPSITDNRVKICIGDAFEFDLGKYGTGTYDYAWYDIWTPISSDNVAEMTKLRRRYGRKVLQQFCWCEKECRRHLRKEKRDESNRRWY